MKIRNWVSGNLFERISFEGMGIGFGEEEEEMGILERDYERSGKIVNYEDLPLYDYYYYAMTSFFSNGL